MLSLAGYQFKGRAPIAYIIACWSFLIHFAIGFALIMTVPWWASTTQDATNSHLVPSKYHVAYYSRPMVGPFLNYDFTATFTSMAVMAAVMWRYRDRLEHLGRAKPEGFED